MASQLQNSRQACTLPAMLASSALLQLPLLLCRCDDSSLPCWRQVSVQLFMRHRQYHEGQLTKVMLLPAAAAAAAACCCLLLLLLLLVLMMSPLLASLCSQRCCLRC